MTCRRSFVSLSLLVALAVLAPVESLRAADEQPLTNRVETVSLFKNGLAIVRRVADAKESGQFRLDPAPMPVHGTFWIESDADVRARVTIREVATGLTNAAMNPQELLAGRRVTVFFREGAIPAVSGTVVEMEKTQPDWSRRPYPVSVNLQYLVIKTPKGAVSLIDRSTIAHLQADGGPIKVKQKRPALILDVKNLKKPTPIYITYLARGISWAPSYRVDVSDPKSLAIRQQAVIRNELEDLENAEVRLISGFPQVVMQLVTSPLASGSTWAQFFSQLSQDPNAQAGQSGYASNFISQQRAAPQPAAGFALGATPDGEGVDVHYESIGRISLRKGGSFLTSVGEARADYERVVEWIVPDTRDANGRRNQSSSYNRRMNQTADSPWDAIRFRNPLKFPMTTAPAMIVTGDRFNGQTDSFWVNRGETTSLRVTKALSVRTRATEQEEPGEREVIYVGGRRFQRVSVKGQLAISNNRNETITLIVRRRFSGDLIKAGDEPKLVLREEGVYSVNRRNELNWRLELKAGETKSLDYSYRVLVNY